MKIVNVVLAIGAGIIVGSLVTLGIKAFYPEPQAPDYTAIMKPVPAYPPTPCAANDTQCKKELADYNAAQQAAQQKFDDANVAYQDAMKVYNKNLFIIANIVGIAVFAVGFWILFSTAIAAQGAPIGVMMAGLWSIIYGYARGWGSIDDKLKFFVGLVIAMIVIGGSIWLMQRHAKKVH